MILSSLSGFPELLPADRITELHILDSLRQTFELHGFASLETRAVETLETLGKKGETSKEVYALSRVNDPDQKQRELGLHFDLTVPFARYVTDNTGQLTFPFKRYQIQKVWRGERPQEGRFREFTQADIDVVGADSLPFHYEVELPLIMAEAFANLPIGQVRIQVNNRKVCQGFYEGLGIDDITATLRTIDKLDKIGVEAVTKTLVDDVGHSIDQAEAAVQLAGIVANDAQDLTDQVRRFDITHPLLDEGLSELGQLLCVAGSVNPGVITAVLKIARGLDYYTGSVYETVLCGHEDLGSIGGGGRYDSLAMKGKRRFPGVGISIGVTRMLSRVLPELRSSRHTPAAILIAVNSEDQRAQSNAIAAKFRARAIACDVAPSAAKFGKQIRHADRLGIPYVYFPDSGEVKDIRSGQQFAADPTTWVPPANDLHPQIIRVGNRDE